MLISLLIKNFRSILELELPLSYGEAKAPNGYQELTTLPFLEQGGHRGVPVLGLFGANASGKSNAILAMSIFKQLLGGHSPNLFMPNKLHLDMPATTLSICGCLSDIGTFTYTVEYDAKEILREVLDCEGKILFEQNKSDIELSGLQTKFYKKERLLDIYRVECLNREGKHTGCILSRIAMNYAGLNPVVAAVYESLNDDLDVYESNQFSNKDGLNALMAALGKQNDARQAFAEIDVLLRKLDLGIQRMEYQPDVVTAADDATEAIHTYHRNDRSEEVQFDFRDESMGTRAAFGLLGVCLAALHTGKTLVIDEIDSSLHSLLAIEIIKLFKDKRYNYTNAQLIFSAHNTDLLDRELLRVSEVGIVNKNLKHGSVLKRLSDFKGVRNVTNFRKQYLEGRFSGIPFPYL